MSIRAETTIETFPSDHKQISDNHCPTCHQRLPPGLTAAELEARLTQQQTEAVNAHERALRKELDQEKLDAVKTAREDEAVKAKQREKVIREEAEKNAQSAMNEKLKKSDSEKQAALEGKKALETANRKLIEQQEEQKNEAIQKALTEQREALTDDNAAKIRKIEADKFKETQNLQKQVDKLKRQLEQKNANELGEGAEVDLFEELKATFDGDVITRIKKGQPGADIRHEIKHNGKNCGTILYDSKNHGAWRNSFLEKLKKDQLADKADHAFLATRVFPSGCSQVSVKNGIIVVNPARIVELVRIFREHLIQIHRLRLSDREKNGKKEALYNFVTSQNYHQLAARQAKIARDFLELDEREKDAHDKIWKARGSMVRDLQKVQNDVSFEIDKIIEDGAC